MVSRPPDHCPDCGTPLQTVDPPTAYHCDDCSEYVFHNPAPNVRVVVLDGDREAALLVEIADESRIGDPPYERDSEWMAPGGHVEVHEHPHEAAARELAEETDLAVDPGDLVLFDAVTRQVVEGAHATVLLYAVERSATSGTPTAAEDASDARFWSPAGLSRSDAAYRDLYDEPDRYRTLAGLIDAAVAGLSST